ncbi:MAG: glycoside hydrolase family 2 protein [Oscillospiraceae bacterium]|nr:glycoside hydrolase family 2 protein [Oscillospiraceae bacterium]
MRQYLNNDWQFTEVFIDDLFDPAFTNGLHNVRLPHTVRETPFHYFDEACYQMLCGYRRKLRVPWDWIGKRVFLSFGAAAHRAEVFCNGTSVGEHRCGYTAFTVELTPALHFGKDNWIVVRLDSREDQNLPPFGFVIDYMTYGGLYREAWLDVTEQTRIADVWPRAFVPVALTIPAEKEARAALRFEGSFKPVVELDGPAEGLTLRYSVRDLETGTIHACGEYPAGESPAFKIPDAALWDVEHPRLYELKTELLDGEKVLDEHAVRFGFRRSGFRADGYYLNDRKLRLRGLDRHQSWPYVGYAMPASQQRHDAEVLKNELALNVVRTSHYPQSQHFIDRCDELGLLVFTEIPGWQHVGDEEWKAQAVRNTEDMVRQYRHHPSVILWGVRINESQDDDALYAETNAAAHRLDPDRQTSGVRYLKQSNLLEDVYAYNDFLHDGTNAGCEKREKVTPDLSRGYLISEYNGHMFPTKSFDDEVQRQEHALRHARVLDAVAGERDISGCIGWCMSDYNTHRDFGSGDRICYHGVLDMFRNPKMAAAVYASQQDERPVLEIGSQMDVGEHAASLRGDVWVFTNADSVRMYKNGALLREFAAKDSPFRNLKHGPILIDDFIGDRLAPEGFTKTQEKLVKDILNAAARFGMFHLPREIRTKAAAAMALYGMSFEDAYRLYGKYIGDWGQRYSGFRFEAVKNGEVVAERVCAPTEGVHIKAAPSHTELCEGDCYDVVSVRLRVCGDHGETLPFWNEPLPLRVEGPAELIGPDRAFIAGGMGGTYLRTTGEAGEVTLSIALPREYGGAETTLSLKVM